MLTDDPSPVVPPSAPHAPCTENPLSHSPNEPPRKRQRTQGPDPASGLSPPLYQDASTSTSSDSLDDLQDCEHAATDAMMIVSDPVVRDEAYYIDGADCVIRVENTLFRVHRFLLARDSSAFQDMFSLPLGEGSQSALQEGFSDSNPIRLFGDTAQEFRTLLSLLYAL
ncbi:uncharacterized protein FIBRA_01268 [Fibroporia radiculosa]|uniref:BTB domain-containing protein n=1 Tax=Fibroporia radiculosa TaxID=599839 RepID=J4G0W3_9APHY|nr:uncharacterized protein FIBRA_01268 [Fibroporia radiculosa]CCL99253.1 predicted protein [Fibroporia radiculosa]